ncbi:predicted protein [Chaetomium globosum CBS 148.51]|uniref:Uncharacterized protein n=1 Tax=Chaetomium globosum (strain ATCC 6205 / CBS 148.51 / DSM 1962 / NBRC 6347 / NRRL 1970) TaxID=306901 RepID=Q2GRQ9_CHAGB|nr:uncharacterized protein CHGG_09345 [Chaetomium globosum CBS 148.51]EAQ85331.1 predicted protein [Chaetomium globosum CBS 148.51]
MNDMALPPEEQTPTSSSPEKYPYEARIRDCFRCWPTAAVFYQSLIDYLHTTSSDTFSPLQVPTTYLLGHHLDRNGRTETPHGSPVPRSQSFSSSTSAKLTQRPSLPTSISTPTTDFQRARLARQSHLTVVEGLLAPESVGILGEMYQTRPEFFIDHLAFDSCGYGSDSRPGGGRDQLPNLPSKRDNIIHVRFMSMLKISGNAQTVQPAQRFSASLTSRFERRTSLEAKRSAYDRRLFQHKHYGATRFRALHVHKEEWLTVEQMVSFSVKREGDKIWHGLLLLDGGREFENVDPPWAEYMDSDKASDSDSDPSTKTGFIPVIPYNVPAIPPSVDEEQLQQAMLKVHRPYHPAIDLLLATATTTTTLNSPPTSPNLTTSDAHLLAEDPFYILSRVYHAAARTRIQLLSFLEADITECSAASAGGAITDGAQQSLVLDQLRFNLQLVRRVERFCKEDLGSIGRLGSAGWPRAGTEEGRERMGEIKEQLLEDYGFLVEQCGHLALQCETASGALVSLAQWMDAREGIRESGNVANLTVLAIVFVPLGYVSSCLSMNVTFINVDEGIQIWIWGVASGVSVVLTGILVMALMRWKR